MRRLLIGLTGAALVLAAPSSAAQEKTWNFDQARIPAAEAAGRHGSGVTVAVIDTWIDRGHPEFGGRVLAGADCVGGECRPGAVTADQCEAHGTHVAGTVASKAYGVAPSARILPLRVLRWEGSDCGGSSTDVAAAIRFATAQGVRVINLSLGADLPIIGRDSDLIDAVAAAAAAGIVVVFAAGNAGLPIADAYGDNALIVAATDVSGDIASYSQYGSGVSIAAPGGDVDPRSNECTVQTCVVSTWSNGTSHEYAATAGTSMAAPHVAGLAALLFGQNPSRSREDVISRIEGTARAVAGGGAGLIDATAALGVRAPAPAPAPQPSSAAPKPKPRPKPVTTQPGSTTPVPVPAPIQTVSSLPPASPPAVSLPEPEIVAVPATTVPVDDASRSRTAASALAIALVTMVGAAAVWFRRSA